ncbi:MAG TPA: glycine/sarcosine/betaine reductase component B subunit [Chloroflexota bacterium]
MRLELASFNIRDIDWGSATALRDGLLTVDRDDIRRLILEDSHFKDVQLHLVHPGESVRVINGLDAVEPRWKVSGAGGVFPGFICSTRTVGDGRTHRLAGAAVLEVSAPVPGEQTHFREQILDMSGPGAEFTPLSLTHNLVLEFTAEPSFFPPGSEHPKDVLGGGPEANDYSRALHLAGIKAAARLAQASIDQQPDEIEVFDLPKCDAGLPRTVCLYHAQRPFLYGEPAALPFPTLIHPNEAFDGAIVGWRQSYRCTYGDQNHQVLRELCRHHGRDLNFLGVIMFGDESPTRVEKERIASGAAKMAQLLHADAAIMLGINGSNLAVDTMLTIQECERLGINTTLVYMDVGYGNDDPGFIHAVAEADAIVCIGSRDRPITLPPVERLIGGQRLITVEDDPGGELTVRQRFLHTACSVQGLTTQTTRFY